VCCAVPPQLCTTYFEMHALIVPNVDCFLLAGHHKVQVQERIYREQTHDWKLWHSSYVLGDLLLREPLLTQVNRVALWNPSHRSRVNSGHRFNREVDRGASIEC